MITRITGKLDELDGSRAVIVAASDPFAYEVLLPAFLAIEFTPRIGQTITLVTLQYFEGQGQGSSFVPRLLGFENVQQRAFFELFTTVNGIGNRKALRAFAHKPSIIARAIHEKDARLLATLPEIGKRMAERIIAELDGKVDAYLGSEGGSSGGKDTSLPRVELKPSGRMLDDPVQEDAVAALMALGQSRGEAEENVLRAVQRATKNGKKITTPEQLVEAVFA